MCDAWCLYLLYFWYQVAYQPCFGKETQRIAHLHLHRQTGGATLHSCSATCHVRGCRSMCHFEVMSVLELDDRVFDQSSRSDVAELLHK